MIFDQGCSAKASPLIQECGPGYYFYVLVSKPSREGQAPLRDFDDEVTNHDLIEVSFPVHRLISYSYQF